MDQVTQNLLGESFFSIALGLWEEKLVRPGDGEKRRGAVMPSTLWLELCAERFEEEPGREEGLGQAAGKGHTRREGTNCCLPGRKPFPVVHSARR